MLTFYGYKKCNTCCEAEKALSHKKTEYRFVDITLNPPSLKQLSSWVQSEQLELKQLLNTSGVDYRAQKMSEKVKTLPPQKILELLSKNGKLLKRPLITNGKKVTAGFKNPSEVLKVWR